MTRQERMKQQRQSETMLNGIMKDQETAKYKERSAKGRTKIMGRVHKRMSESYSDPNTPQLMVLVLNQHQELLEALQQNSLKDLRLV